MKNIVISLVFIFLTSSCFLFNSEDNYGSRLQATTTTGWWVSADSKTKMLDSSTYHYGKDYACLWFYEDGVFKDSILIEEVVEMSYKKKTKIIRARENVIPGYGKVYSLKRVNDKIEIGEPLIFKGPAQSIGGLKGKEERVFYRLNYPFIDY